MNESKRNVVLYIIILILACIIIGLGVYVFYNKDDSCECTKCKNNNSKGNVVEPTATPEPTPTATLDPDKDKLVTSVEPIGELDLPISRKIKLGGEIRSLEIKKGDTIYEVQILLDEKKFHSLDDPFSGIRGIYVLNEEVILVTEYIGCGDAAVYAYDKDLNKLSVYSTLDKEYPKSMHYYFGALNSSLIIDEATDTIKLSGIRFTGCESSLQNEDGTSEYVYDDDGNLKDKFVGELESADYEIKYLGNGKFSEPVRVSGSEYYLTKENNR